MENICIPLNITARHDQTTREYTELHTKLISKILLNRGSTATLRFLKYGEIYFCKHNISNMNSCWTPLKICYIFEGGIVGVTGSNPDLHTDILYGAQCLLVDRCTADAQTISSHLKWKSTKEKLFQEASLVDTAGFSCTLLLSPSNLT